MLCKFILSLFNRENVDFETESENETKNTPAMTQVNFRSKQDVSMVFISTKTGNKLLTLNSITTIIYFVRL